MLLEIKAYKITSEDETIKTVAKWYEDQINASKNEGNKNTFFDENSSVFASHVLFHYFQGENSI